MAKAQAGLVIQTAGLTKVFRNFWGKARVRAVDSLNLEIAPREVFGLLGPNGSGKSTTIKMLLGLLFPSRGWARVLGMLPGDVKTNQRIGYLPEESFLYPFLNARETLDFYGRLFSLTHTQRKQRIDSLLDMVGLSAVTHRPIGEFSKGMMRRVGLAQALINDPDLLILDEPTSGMDPIGTRQIKDLIAELGRRGKTILLSSHLLADVEDVCDRICILYGGKIRNEGKVDDLLARKNFTQITTASLSEQCLARIEATIRSEYPDYHVEIETPRDRLESFFLKTVEEAHASEIETSGARMGGSVSDFLVSMTATADDTEAVIENLLKKSEPQSITEQPTMAVTPVAVDNASQDLINSLTGKIDTVAIKPFDHTEDEQPGENLTTPVKPVDTPAPSEAVDLSVIDDLLKKDKPQS